MVYQLKILRGAGNVRFWQTFDSPCTCADSVARALEELNERTVLRDSAGQEAEPIAWECACLEKKCGACAMVIGGTPRLACATRLCEAADKGGCITLEPLKKFRRIRDLQVDRGEMFTALQEMELWLENDAELVEEERRALHYRAASCLMCGLCLEVCPNFSPGRTFAGAAAAAAAYRAFEPSAAGAHREALRTQYRKRFFNDCAKSLACQDICPAQVPVEQLLVKTNAAAIWRRREKKHGAR